MIKLLVAFIKRFCQLKNGGWSTRKFGFLATGLNYQLINWSGFIYALYERESELALQFAYLSAGVFIILATCVHPNGAITQLISNIFSKSESKIITNGNSEKNV